MEVGADHILRSVSDLCGNVTMPSPNGVCLARHTGDEVWIIWSGVSMIPLSLGLVLRRSQYLTVESSEQVTSLSFDFRE